MSIARTVAKNTTVLFLAEIVSRGVSTVYAAILARYIQADGVGKIVTGQALVGALIVLVEFGLDRLVIRDVAGAREKAASYVNNIVFIRLLLSLVFGLSLSLIVQVLGYSAEQSAIVYLYAVAAILQTFTDIGRYIFQAFEKMEYDLLLRIIRVGVNICLSLLAIYLRYSLLVIVGISAFAALVELVVGYILLRRRFVSPRLKVDLGLIKRLLLAALPLALMAVYPLARSHLSTLILSVTDNMENVGAFGSANMVVTMLMLIPTVFMRAVFPVFSRLSGQSSLALQNAYQKSFIYLFVLGLALSAGTFLTADRIILLLLGDGFQRTVPALRIMAWLPLVGFVGYCNGNLLIAVGKEGLFMLTEGLFAVLYLILGFVLTTRFGYVGSSLARLIPTVIGFGFYSVLVHRLLGLSLPWRKGLAATLAALAMGCCVYLMIRGGVSFFVTALFVAPAVYAVALYLLKVLSIEDVRLFKRVLRLA
jgi:O-antigen/teichoic acid export membrane protein